MEDDGDGLEVTVGEVSSLVTGVKSSLEEETLRRVSDEAESVVEFITSETAFRGVSDTASRSEDDEEMMILLLSFG
jgi:hypothetical protein